MAESNNATCSICGKSYHKCLSCRDTLNLRPWQIYCCSSDCYKIFQLVRGYNTGIYTKKEFGSKLKNLNLDGLENYEEDVVVLIKGVLKEENLIEKPIAEVTLVEETPVVDKPITSRKRNYKINSEVEAE